MRVPMTAKRGFVYAGHNYRAGQEFEAHSESNARFLTQVGHAERTAPPAVPVYQTRMMVAAPVVPMVTETKSEEIPAWQADAPLRRGPGRPRTKKTDE